MIDVRFLISDPHEVFSLLGRRGITHENIQRAHDKVLRARAKRRDLESIYAIKNQIDKDLAPELQHLQLKQKRLRLRDECENAEHQMEKELQNLPNIPLLSTPDGLHENNNLIVAEHAGNSHTSVYHKVHEGFQNAVAIPNGQIAGAGFEMLRGNCARMLRALSNFALKLHADNFEELALPAIVSQTSMLGSAHLPKFAEAAFPLEGERLWLAPTAEVAFCALHRSTCLEEACLPVRYISSVPCFRREIGSGGVAARFRLHQYHQVELFSICDPAQSIDELAFMLQSAELALRELGLHFRSTELCCGKLPFSAAKAYKLEVFLPISARWIDVSTISLSTDFLARRSNIRMTKTGRRTLVHTLNASAMACSRVRVALMEYGFAENCATIPSVLMPYY